MAANIPKKKIKAIPIFIFIQGPKVDSAHRFVHEKNVTRPYLGHESAGHKSLPNQDRTLNVQSSANSAARDSVRTELFRAAINAD
jgi:hypothetical protein